MSGSITVQPYVTNQPQASFLLQTQGYVQGAPLDDPTARMELAGGKLKSTESLPMWGGVPIEEFVNLTGSASEGIGPDLARAVSQATVTGWSTNLQANSMVITSTSHVPLAAVGDSVNFFRYGSNARLAVACDPAIYAALQTANGSIGGQALYWDVTNYRITLVTTGGNFALPVSTKLLSLNQNSKLVAYASGSASYAAGTCAIVQF